MDRLNSTQKNLVAAIIGIVLFVASTGLSYTVFASHYGTGPLANSYVPSAAPTGGEDPNAPKTAQCPLNGSMHTQAAQEAWNKRRPLAVMIENSTDARPQSGITQADVVYEAVAEGGITRFMAVFYCNSVSDIQVGPVRSARTYFLDWESEYDALYAHVGGANTPGPADALGQIVTYKIKDMNQFSIGFPTYWRDYDRLRKSDGSAVATEHTMYSSTQKLWNVGQQRGWANPDSDGVKWEDGFTPWKFVDGTPATTPVNPISVHFWESVGYASDYNVVWNYDASCNCYKRQTGGVNHMDKDNDQQLAPSNVVVQYQQESRAHDGYTNDEHLLYGDKGQGKAVVFQNGKAITGQWVKASRTAREKFVDDSGKEIPFVKGQIWIETVPVGSKVSY
jgi:hypothetical protein